MPNGYLRKWRVRNTSCNEEVLCMIALYIIGYMVVGMLVFWIEHKQDMYYRDNLCKKYAGRKAEYVGDSSKFYWSSGIWALDEYHRRTQFMPKNADLLPKVLAPAILGAVVIWILWPIASIISPIYNHIVYKSICKKAEGLA